MRIRIASWIATSCLTLGAFTQPASAGQWWDSMMNSRRPPAYPIGAPTPVTQNYASVVSNYGSYASQPPSATGLSAIPLGVPQTMAAYLPTASYDTVWNQTPVTYYRPVTSFDPRTGTTVTSLQPCTSVQYQAQRPPMIAPRPLSGEYGMQVNKWPGITGPGYNPTGLAYSANYPGFQQLPNGGYYPASGPAPLGTSGSSTGMPASSLPVTTIPAYAPNAFVPTPLYAQPNVAGANMFTPATSIAPYATSVPYATTYSSSFPSYSSSNVVPAASWTNAYASGYQPNQPSSSAVICANGYCQPQAGTFTGASPTPNSGFVNPTSGYANGYSNSSSGAPNIPGATVTPLGPPVYSSAPPVAPNYGNPSPAGNIMPPSTGIMPPSTGIMPPSTGAGNPSGFDPESMRQPSLSGGQASVQRATTDHMVSGGSGASNTTNHAWNAAKTETSPTSDILPKSTASTASNDSTFAMKEIDRPTANLLPRHEVSRPSSFLDPAYSNPSTIPDTLSAGKPIGNANGASGNVGTGNVGTGNVDTGNNGNTGNRVAPLEAPAGVDTRARKNPSLYDGDDPIANRSTIRSTQRIVTLEETDDAKLRFVAGPSRAYAAREIPKETEPYDVVFRPRVSPE
ncbi:MAG: hypothetical protein NTY42_06000 [Planctomycetota bacterium]|nr:hypothetical protein [Planctomycetota bacterium]